MIIITYKYKWTVFIYTESIKKKNSVTAHLYTLCE